MRATRDESVRKARNDFRPWNRSFVAIALCAAVGLAAGNSADAATYYVDAVAGNDAWPGTASAPQGTPPSTGPWRTLAKVGAANIQPGDVVRLKCGSTWRETLRLAKSGTAAALIRFDAYGTGCVSSPPTIDGANAVIGWQRHGSSTSNIWKASVNFDVTQVIVNGVFVKPAQHPNAGFDPRHPSTTFLAIDSARLNAQGATNGIVDGELKLAAGQDLIGAGVHVRSNDYTFEFRPVASYSALSKTITLTGATNYVMQAGYGYYLVNKLWMLDSPGEWYLQRTPGAGGSVVRTLYVWLPESRVPAATSTAADNVVYATGAGRDGISARDQQYLVMTGLRLRNHNVGLDVSGTQSGHHRVSRLTVENSALVGIKLDESTSVKVDGAMIRNSGYQGVQGNFTKSLWIANCTIENSGTVGSPRGQNPLAADYQLFGIECFGCVQLQVTDNTLRNTGYISIAAFARPVPTGVPGNLIAGNYIENSCMVLDDCAAIYVIGRNGMDPNGFLDKTQIRDNIVINSLGNPNGRPAGGRTAAQGIYLDDYSNGPVVTGNTVINADNGLQIHLGSNIEATKNTLFGNRRNGIWMQENFYPTNAASCKDGNNCLKNNVIRENLIFPKLGTLSVAEESDYLTTTDFAAYDLNRYSSLRAPAMIQEQYIAGGKRVVNDYAFAQWRSVRGEDPRSSTFNAFGVAPWRVTAGLDASGNVVANGGFDAGTADWSVFPADASTAWETRCVTGGCVQFTGGGTQSILISDRFAVRKGKRYLLRFEGRAAAANTAISVIVRKNGPTYESVTAPETSEFRLASRWQAFNTIVTAGADALDESGGRIDFEIPAGATVYLDNVYVSTVTASQNDTSKDARILLNRGTTPIQVRCPNAKITDGRQCGNFVHFWDGLAHGTPVTWPITIPAKGSKIVVWTADPNRDSDLDGIADANDLCPATAALEPVNERGCAFEQLH